jgi:DNA repair protein RAD50
MTYSLSQLKAKILEITQSISKMEADEEELAAEVMRVDQENILYVATATQFNQTYTIVEGLENRIEETKKDIAEQERTTQELDDTEEELEAKIQNHNKHKSTLEREGLRLKAALNEEKARLEEERENLNKATRLLGQLQAEAKVSLWIA